MPRIKVVSEVDNVMRSDLEVKVIRTQTLNSLASSVVDIGMAAISNITRINCFAFVVRIVSQELFTVCEEKVGHLKLVLVVPSTTIVDGDDKLTNTFSKLLEHPVRSSPMLISID